MDLSKREFGRWGEDRAVRHLRHLGYRIIERNWRSPDRHVCGEIDVVAAIDDILVFCEVKTRRSARHGGAVAAVDLRKQLRIRRLAAGWIRHRLAEPGDRIPGAQLPGVPFDGVRFDGVRFDVITVEGVDVRHWRGAF
jgi:putative endonuclease